MNSRYGLIGWLPGSVGDALVTGAGSHWTGENLGVGVAGGTGSLTLADGGQVNMSDGVYIHEGGSLLGNGVINGDLHNQGGVIAPGFSPGAITVNGDFLFDSGVLKIEVASLASFDSLIVNGNATFTGGTILFSFIDGFLPKDGDIINFLFANTASISSNVTLDYQGVDPGFQFQIDPIAGGLRFIALNDALNGVPEPATLFLLLIGFAGLVRASRVAP